MSQCCSGDDVYDRQWWLSSHSMSVMCHLCISLFSFLSSPVTTWREKGKKKSAFKASQSRVYASSRMLCANYIAKLQLSSRLTSQLNWGASVWMGAQQHAPAVLHSDSLLGHETFISRTQCIATRNISKDTRTIGCVWCSPVEPTSHAASWHVAGWKCLHLTFGMFFSLHLTLRYFCTHCIPCTIFFFLSFHVHL